MSPQQPEEEATGDPGRLGPGPLSTAASAGEPALTWVRWVWAAEEALLLRTQLGLRSPGLEVVSLVFWWLPRLSAAATLFPPAEARAPLWRAYMFAPLSSPLLGEGDLADGSCL